MDFRINLDGEEKCRQFAKLYGEEQRRHEVFHKSDYIDIPLLVIVFRALMIVDPKMAASYIINVLVISLAECAPEKSTLIKRWVELANTLNASDIPDCTALRTSVVICELLTRTAQACGGLQARTKPDVLNGQVLVWFEYFRPFTNYGFMKVYGK